MSDGGFENESGEVVVDCDFFPVILSQKDIVKEIEAGSGIRRCKAWAAKSSTSREEK